MGTLPTHLSGSWYVAAHYVRGSQNLVAIFQRYYCPVLISKAGYNGKNGYPIQGLIAKMKDTVANG